MDFGHLIAADSAENDVAVQESSTKHKNAGMNLFAARQLDTGQIHGFYVAALVYSDLSGKTQK